MFKDIGGSALLAGVFSEEATEVHIPYNPKDEREVSSYMQISNNLITSVASEDWGCVGIGIGYARNTLIEHNEIENVSYTGISIGWGFTGGKSKGCRNHAAQIRSILESGNKSALFCRILIAMDARI